MLDITKYHHIHCIGIGGIGLSAVAEIFHSRGYTVSGSDMKLSDTTSHLASRGIRIFEGHDAGGSRSLFGRRIEGKSRTPGCPRGRYSRRHES